jgi:nucleotide-binding universal stress UspA family protein
MTRVLVPVAVLEGETVSPGLLTLLEPVDVTVLGYQILPEQTPPDQARLQYEDRATSALEDLVAEFRAGGGDADHRLVFTHDQEQSVERISEEIGVDAFAISGMAGDAEQLLVSLSGDVDVARIVDFVEELVDDRAIGVTLFTAAENDDGGERVEAAAKTLRDAGISVETDVARSEQPFESLIERAPDHDVIVMGETAPSYRSVVFGDETDRVAAASVGPVIVVRGGTTPDS